MLVSEPILSEYGRALAYERVRAYHRMSDTEIAKVVDGIRDFALVVAPAERLRVVPEDPKDDMFVECAKAGGAPYIVSGDKHLRAVGAYEGIQIVSPAVFLALFDRGER